MVIIDTKNDIAYENVSKVEAGRIIGVDRTTIHNWSKREEKKQVYNFFTIYFDCNKLKIRRKKRPD